jgi:hypothetical protein
MPEWLPYLSSRWCTRMILLPSSFVRYKVNDEEKIVACFFPFENATNHTTDDLARHNAPRSFAKNELLTNVLIEPYSLLLLLSYPAVPLLLQEKKTAIPVSLYRRPVECIWIVCPGEPTARFLNK